MIPWCVIFKVHTLITVFFEEKNGTRNYTKSTKSIFVLHQKQNFNIKERIYFLAQLMHKKTLPNLPHPLHIPPVPVSCIWCSILFPLQIISNRVIAINRNTFVNLSPHCHCREPMMARFSIDLPFFVSSFC